MVQQGGIDAAYWTQLLDGEPVTIMAECPGSWKCALCLPLRLSSQTYAADHSSQASAREAVQDPCDVVAALSEAIGKGGHRGRRNKVKAKSCRNFEATQARLDQHPRNIIVIAASAGGGSRCAPTRRPSFPAISAASGWLVVVHISPETAARALRRIFSPGQLTFRPIIRFIVRPSTETDLCCAAVFWHAAAAETIHLDRGSKGPAHAPSYGSAVPIGGQGHTGQETVGLC